MEQISKVIDQNFSLIFKKNDNNIEILYNTPNNNSELNIKNTQNIINLGNLYDTRLGVILADNIITDPKQQITNLIDNQKTVTYIVCTITAVATIALVVVFTYYVAVTLARPLRKLISIASQINNNTIHNKALMKETMEKLTEMEKESQHQVQKLITTFKNLLQNIEKRNTLQKPKEKQRHIDYPLNQYDPEFVQQTKGDSEINWKELIKEVGDTNFVDQKK